MKLRNMNVVFKTKISTETSMKLDIKKLIPATVNNH